MSINLPNRVTAHVIGDAVTFHRAGVVVGAGSLCRSGSGSMFVLVESGSVSYRSCAALIHAINGAA